jgi:hypothetical protein
MEAASGAVRRSLAHILRRLRPRDFAEVSKWTEEGKDELKVGQIVLLSTEKPARGHWPRARVTGIKEAGRSRDGITRTVTVKLADGTEYSRPVQQLVRLELDYPDQDGVEAEAPLPGPSVHHLGDA